MEAAGGTAGEEAEEGLEEEEEGAKPQAALRQRQRPASGGRRGRAAAAARADARSEDEEEACVAALQDRLSQDNGVSRCVTDFSMLCSQGQFVWLFLDNICDRCIGSTAICVARHMLHIAATP